MNAGAEDSTDPGACGRGQRRGGRYRGTHRQKKGACHQGHAALGCGVEVTEQSSGLAVATVSGAVTAGSTARGKQCCLKGRGGMKPSRGQTMLPTGGMEMGDDEGPKGNPYYWETMSRRLKTCLLCRFTSQGSRGGARALDSGPRWAAERTPLLPPALSPRPGGPLRGAARPRSPSSAEHAQTLAA